MSASQKHFAKKGRARTLPPVIKSTRQNVGLLCGLDAPIRMLVEEHDSLETVFLRATDEGAKNPAADSFK